MSATAILNATTTHNATTKTICETKRIANRIYNCITNAIAIYIDDHELLRETITNYLVYEIEDDIKDKIEYEIEYDLEDIVHEVINNKIIDAIRNLNPRYLPHDEFVDDFIISIIPKTIYNYFVKQFTAKDDAIDTVHRVVLDTNYMLNALPDIDYDDENN